MNRLLAISLAMASLLACRGTGQPSETGQQKPPDAYEPVQLTEEALRIHREAIVVDTHNDLPWQFRKRGDLGFQAIDIRKPQPQLHTDIPRLQKGGVGVQFWAAYVPVESLKGPAAVEATLEQIDVIQRMIRRHPDVFEMAHGVDDILRIRRSGKIASLIGVEGGHSINNSLAVLRSLYALGTRYMTLTHSETLDWADAATDQPRHQGLTPFGEQVVAEMNRLGMMVDISHVSADTMRHVLRVTRAPVIASHSSAYALAAHPRNVPDDVLRQLPKNGGVVMVNFFSGFIVPEGARASQRYVETARALRKQYPDDQQFQQALEQWRRENPFPTGSVKTVVDHIEHIIKTAGIDHVGLGSDYDGITRTPRQLEDVSCYPYITQELLNRGYRREEIHKVLGGNLLRVFRQVEEAARRQGS